MVSINRIITSLLFDFVQDMNTEIRRYTYVPLQGAAGEVNIVGVVKFFRPACKSRGSGYSLFASITDPSLNGDKLPCVFFSDCEQNLPQVSIYH